MRQMLDSIPIPLRAVLLLLLGAAAILTLSRLLPNLLRRPVAAAVAFASLVILWSLRSGTPEAIEIQWVPLTLFRMGPALLPDSLSLLVGIALAWATSALLLGIAGTQPQKGSWHGLMLVVLAGCLVMTMATNLIALALGSGLLDLALLAWVVSARHEADRVAWRMAVPGLASTGLIVLGALQMDAQVGTASLLTQGMLAQTVVLLSVAGALRMLVFPFHPRGLHTAENAALSLLLSGAGIYLAVRAVAITPDRFEPAWTIILGGAALLAGALLAWTQSVALERADTPEAAEGGSEATSGDAVAALWPGLAVGQTGYALTFILLAGRSEPWPLFNLTLALGVLAIWWDGARSRATVPSTDRLQPLLRRAERYLSGAQSALKSWGAFLPGKRWSLLLPGSALACLAGVPLTVGAIGRWRFYSVLLQSARPWLLLVALCADTCLVAALWAIISALRRQAADRRPGPGSLLAMMALAIPLVVLGLAPGAVSLDWEEVPEASVWAVGALYFLPWLLGAALARGASRFRPYLGPVPRLINLDWLFPAAGQAGHGLISGTHWLGRVGEGRGWFGWALIILALCAIFLAAR